MQILWNLAFTKTGIKQNQIIPKTSILVALFLTRLLSKIKFLSKSLFSTGRNM